MALVKSKPFFNHFSFCFSVLVIVLICEFYFRDNYILLQAIIASMICYISPPLMMINSTIPLAIPLWNTKGLIVLIVLHVTFSEPLYYFLHRSVHRNNYLFTHYHSFHHSSTVPNPMTGKFSLILHPFYKDKKIEKIVSQGFLFSIKFLLFSNSRL